MTSSAPVRPAGPVVLQVLGVVLAVGAGLLWLMPIGIFLFLVPRFAEVFAKFDVALPGLTQAILVLGEWGQHYWFLVAAGWLVVVSGLTVAVLTVRSWWPMAVAAALLALSFVVVSVLVLLTVLGLFEPLVVLTDSLSTR